MYRRLFKHFCSGPYSWLSPLGLAACESVDPSVPKISEQSWLESGNCALPSEHVMQLAGRHGRLSRAVRMPHLVAALQSCWRPVADMGPPRSSVCSCAHSFLSSVPFWVESEAERRVFPPETCHIASLTITSCIATAEESGVPYSYMKCGIFWPCLIVFQCAFCPRGRALTPSSMHSAKLFQQILTVRMMSPPHIFSLFSCLICLNVQGDNGNTETLKFTVWFILCRLYWKVKWDTINPPV